MAPKTLHDKYVEAFKHKGGQVLSTKDIKSIMLWRFPEVASNSILPNDHGAGNKSACWCADTCYRVFDRVGRGKYRVMSGLGGGTPGTHWPKPGGKGGQGTGKSVPYSDITKIWDSDCETNWLQALCWYWTRVKKSNRDLEQELNSLDLSKAGDIKDWYSFLLCKYIPWKYTDSRYRSGVTSRFEGEYNDVAGIKRLDKIICQLFSSDHSVVACALGIAMQIKGLGVAGASGLLALLFPGYFGTVDQYVVKALCNVPTLPESDKLQAMNAKSLSISDAVVLVEIMRRKSECLNKIFHSTAWTPRKIDMVLWAMRK